MYYMSPERQENKPYSFDADIWSLGLMVLHMATGIVLHSSTSQLDLSRF
jgi:serine/threonine protein kinase